MHNSLTKEQQLIILGLIASIVVGLGFTAYRHFLSKPDSEIIIQEPQENSQFVQSRELVVHLAGAVKKEGVYKLKAGDRLVDLLEIAGGARADADLSKVNLAEEVKDGKKIIIPAKQKVRERISGDPAIRRSGTFSRKVNLNTATIKELDSLPGIGPSIAAAIVEYRAKNGPFSKTDQLLKVPRVGKSKLKKIKNKIVL